MISQLLGTPTEKEGEDPILRLQSTPKGQTQDPSFLISPMEERTSDPMELDFGPQLSLFDEMKQQCEANERSDEREEHGEAHHGRSGRRDSSWAAQQEHRREAEERRQQEGLRLKIQSAFRELVSDLEVEAEKKKLSFLVNGLDKLKDFPLFLHEVHNGRFEAVSFDIVPVKSRTEYKLVEHDGKTGLEVIRFEGGMIYRAPVRHWFEKQNSNVMDWTNYAFSATVMGSEPPLIRLEEEQWCKQ